MFDAPDRFHYLATRGQDIYVVQEQLARQGNRMSIWR